MSRRTISVGISSLVALVSACATVRHVQQPPAEEKPSVKEKYSCEVDQGTLEKAIAMDPSEIKCHDGDTCKHQKKKYRLAAVDAAECRAYFGNGKGWPDQYGEGEYASINYCKEGREFVKNAIRGAKEVKYVPGDVDDKYGRGLGYLIVDRQLLQCQLVREGLAYEIVTTYGAQGQEYLSQMVLKAAQTVPEPNFQKPWVFRHTSH